MAKGVTIDPNLPSALGRGRVPWDDVGPGWYVALYDSSKAYPTSDTDVREGPSVLYLVSSEGDRYEVAAWEPGDYRYLVDAPAEPPIVVDFGYHDAWPTDDETFVQWRGDCGSAAIATLNADGTADLLEIEEADARLSHGVEMIDIHGDEIAVYGWEGCGADVGGLFTVDLEGRYLDTLVPVVGDSRGVVGVKGLTASPSNP